MGTLPKRQRVGGVRRDPARRPDPAQPALAERHPRRAVDAARRRPRPRRGPARRGGPRDPRGDRAAPPRSGRPPASTPRTCRASGATAGASTPTPCASCTTGGCRSTRRSRTCVEVDGSTAEAAWQPVRRRARRHRPGRAAGARGARATTGRSACSGSRRTPWSRARRARAADPDLRARLPHRVVDAARRRRRPRRVAAAALEREVREECGVACTVGELLDVHDAALQRHRAVGAPRGLPRGAPGLRGRRSPAGRRAAGVEVDGTTDAVAWVPLAEVGSASDLAGARRGHARARARGPRRRADPRAAEPAALEPAGGCPDALGGRTGRGVRRARWNTGAVRGRPRPGRRAALAGASPTSTTPR